MAATSLVDDFDLSDEEVLASLTPAVLDSSSHTTQVVAPPTEKDTKVLASSVDVDDMDANLFGSFKRKLSDTKIKGRASKEDVKKTADAGLAGKSSQENVRPKSLEREPSAGGGGGGRGGGGGMRTSLSKPPMDQGKRDKGGLEWKR